MANPFSLPGLFKDPRVKIIRYTFDVAKQGAGPGVDSQGHYVLGKLVKGLVIGVAAELTTLWLDPANDLLGYTQDQAGNIKVNVAGSSDVLSSGLPTESGGSAPTIKAVSTGVLVAASDSVSIDLVPGAGALVSASSGKLLVSVAIIPL